MKPVRLPRVSLVINGVTVRRGGVWLAPLTPEQTQTLADGYRRLLDYYAQTADQTKSA